jgi:hypothetical protein
MIYFGNQGIKFRGGTTTAFDNFGNPVVNQGGYGKITGRRL